MGSQHYSLKLRDGHGSMDLLAKLFKDKSLLDVTLVCDGVKLRAHRAVLGAFSPYFREIFEENPCKHPVVIFKGIRGSHLASVLQFIYDGELNVAEEDLNGFLALAEDFKVCSRESVEINKDVVRFDGSDGPANLSVAQRSTGSSNPATQVEKGKINVKSEDSRKSRSPVKTRRVSSDNNLVEAANPAEKLPDRSRAVQNAPVVEEAGSKCESAAYPRNSVPNHRVIDTTFAAASLPPTQTASKTLGQTDQNNVVMGGASDGMASRRKPNLVQSGTPQSKYTYVKMTQAKKTQIVDLICTQKKPIQEISDMLKISVLRINQFITGLHSPDFNGKTEIKKPTVTPKNGGGSPKKLTLVKKKKTVKKGSGKKLSATDNKTVPPIKLNIPNAGAAHTTISINVAGSSGTDHGMPLPPPPPSTSRISVELKRNIIDSFLNKGSNPEEISRRLNVPLVKVRRCIGRYRRATAAMASAAVKIKQRHVQKLDSSQQAKLLGFIRRNKKITQVGIQTHVKKEFGVSVSIKTIGKLLKDNDIKLDRPTSNNSRVFAQNSLSTIHARYEYAVALDRQQEPLVFVDECAIGPQRDVSPAAFSCLYVLSALTKHGLLHIVSQKKPFSSDAFVDFLDQLRLLLPTGPHALVMSNIALHRAPRVLEWLPRKDCVQLFLPPSSPFLNPSQRLFQKLQKECGGLDAAELHAYGLRLRELKIPLSECNGWIQDSFRYLPLCHQKSPILHMPPRNPAGVNGGTSGQDLPSAPVYGLAAALRSRQPDLQIIPVEEGTLPKPVEVIEIVE